jgi:CxxC motif-containing protein (DUF1111 family)
MSGRIGSSTNWPVRVRRASVLAGILGAFTCLGTAGQSGEVDGKVPEDRRAQGRELFEREWLPGDSRTHGGDGLGPVYNDSSCIACHNLGGTGGGGPASKNVDIITASPNSNMMPQSAGGSGRGEPGFLGKALGSLVGLDDPADSKTPGVRTPARRKPDTKELIKAHPGFRTARSVVLHRFGVEGAYESWRQNMIGLQSFNPMSPGPAGSPAAMTEAQNSLNLGRMGIQTNVGEFVLVSSQRNPTPLFGAGLIDSIPDRVLEETTKVKHADFPEVAGRVSRMKDKRIGRFGWKAQTPSLQDFVLTACAVELGLEVPGHHQAGLPQKPDAKAKGLDLTGDECKALESYVRGLSKPAERRPSTEADAREIDGGRKLFASVGCATCHTPKLGQVDGIYSDLLLHDMGQQLGDTGQYSVFDPGSSEEEFVDEDPGPIADAASVSTSVSPSEALNTQVQVVFSDSTQANACPTPGSGGPVKRPTTGPASRFEWRTPPLWGFRDSGPYLHDGRAETLDQAVALHGGEASKIAVKYFGLSPRERRQLEAFLKSLTAPVPTTPERVASAK